MPDSTQTVEEEKPFCSNISFNIVGNYNSMLLNKFLYTGQSMETTNA